MKFSTTVIGPLKCYNFLPRIIDSRDTKSENGLKGGVLQLRN